MTSQDPRGSRGLLGRFRTDRLTTRQLRDIVPDSDPRLRARLEPEPFATTLMTFLLFGGPIR